MFCKTIKILLLIKQKISRNDQQQSGDHGGIFKGKKKVLDGSEKVMDNH